jgi:hypothetical protein
VTKDASEGDNDRYSWRRMVRGVRGVGLLERKEKAEYSDVDANSSSKLSTSDIDSELSMLWSSWTYCEREKSEAQGRDYRA